MIPLSIDVPMRRVPWANWILIGVTIVVSLAIPAVKTRSSPIGHHNDLETDLIARLLKQHEYSPLVLQPGNFHAQQLVGHLFQHADFLHLIGNMLFLFVFGNAINAKLGQVQYLLVYFAIGAIVGLAYILLGDGRPCVGASGAIMGICGMVLVLYPRNEVTVWDSWLMGYQGELPAFSAWFLLILYFAFDVWGIVSQSHSGVAYVSHIVGFLLGVTLSVALLKTQWLAADVGEQTLLDWIAGRSPRERTRRRPPAMKNSGQNLPSGDFTQS